MRGKGLTQCWQGSHKVSARGKGLTQCWPGSHKVSVRGKGLTQCWRGSHKVSVRGRDLLNVGEDLIRSLREVGTLSVLEVDLCLVHLCEQRVQVVDQVELQILVFVFIVVLRK